MFLNKDLTDTVLGITMLWPAQGGDDTVTETEKAGVYSGYPRGITYKAKEIVIDSDKELIVGFHGA